MPRRSGCPDRISFRPVPLTDGDHAGTAATEAGIGLVAGDRRAGHKVRGYVDPHAPQAVPQEFAQAWWSSPVVEPGFAFTELVPTWHARTPAASWVEISARVRVPSARWSRWLVLARWADHDASLRSTSVPGQTARHANVATDTVMLPRSADAWQLRVALLAPVASPDPRSGSEGDDGPVVSYLAAMVSAPDPHTVLAADPTTSARGITLDVAPLSQRVHAGHYPRWGGGGDSWCSPTSLAMVLSYWGAGPDRDSLAWVEPDYPDPPVYHAVRHCWDHAYNGAGNWSFNTAYAARFGLGAFVTRLRGLAEAEAFIAAGIPLIASVRVDPAELTGSEYTSAGHLVVIVGFTDEGDVIVNDPAAKDQRTLRRVYRRDQFDRAWGAGSGRIVYVVHPPSVALPRRPSEANW